MISKPRGMGKTYDLIMESARTGIPIITPYMADEIIERANIMGVKIPEPMSLSTYKRYRDNGSLRRNPKWTGRVLVDEVDGLLSKLLGAKVEKCTYTPDSINFNREYVGVWFDKEKEKNDMPTKNNYVLGDITMNGISFRDGLSIEIVKDRRTIITDVNVIVPNKVIEVTFADGKKEKSVCREPDVFSMEQAIAICISKRIMGGSGSYNNAVKAGMKVYENQLKAEKEKKSEEERIAKRRAKREAYKKRRAEKIALAESERRAAEREEQIEIQKEAYLRAMREVNEK